MAGVELQDITRDKIHGLVKDAKQKGKKKKDHVRAELIREYPGIETIRIKRNGSVYNALDYLMEDVESYGEE